MSKKLFVSDLDGTLFWDGQSNPGKPTAESIAAIQRWHEAGNLFAIATARIYLFRENLISLLGFPIDYLGSNGTDLIFSDGGRETRLTPINDFLTVSEWVREHGIDGTVKLYTGGRWINSAYGLYPYTVPERMRMAQLKGVAFSEISPPPTEGGLNMSLSLRSDLLKDAQAALRELVKGRLEVVASDYDNLDFVPTGCGKGDAVRRLAAHHGLSREDVFVIGDSENDVSMFAAAGFSFAMSHADAEVKRLANAAVDSVAEAIEGVMG